MKGQNLTIIKKSYCFPVKVYVRHLRLGYLFEITAIEMVFKITRLLIIVNKL